MAALEAALIARFADLHAVFFWGTIIGVALWEHHAPLRALTRPSGVRWLGNAGVLAINAGLSWLVFPGTALAVAMAGAAWGFGLLRWLPAPDWLAVVVGFLLLDLMRYALHRALHQVPLLWRLHRMHHTDADYDITTGFRFHPLEIVVGLGLNSAAILLLGVPVAAVLLYEMLFPLASFWVHANARVVPWLERGLRLVLVTPGMHRTHHSVLVAEQNSNFGAMFAHWDRWFGSHVAAPEGGPLAMRIGVAAFAEARHQRLGWMLANPFLPGDRTDKRG